MRIERIVTDPARALGRILDALSNQLTPEENFQAKYIDVSDTGTADTEFTVTHNLGVVPTIYVWNIDRAGIVYDSRRVDWTIEEIYLKCSVANAALKLLVMA